MNKYLEKAAELVFYPKFVDHKLDTLTDPVQKVLLKQEDMDATRRINPDDLWVDSYGNIQGIPHETIMEESEDIKDFLSHSGGTQANLTGKGWAKGILIPGAVGAAIGGVVTRGLPGAGMGGAVGLGLGALGAAAYNQARKSSARYMTNRLSELNEEKDTLSAILRAKYPQVFKK